MCEEGLRVVRITIHGVYADVGLHREPYKRATLFCAIIPRFLTTFYTSCTSGKKNEYSAIYLVNILKQLITS